MKQRLLATVFMAAVGGLLVQVVAAEAMLFGSAENGGKWHAEKCISCHAAKFADEGNEIYTRENRRVQTIEGLMQQVQFCSANTGANFSPEQLDDVTAYLNQHFYHFGDEQNGDPNERGKKAVK